MADLSLYTVGGTVQAGRGVYLPRNADDELLALCLNQVFTSVLTPRQMGKSSLMIKTAERLLEAGTRSAIIDLNKIGVELTAEQWYLGILTLINNQLKLNTDVTAWWRASSLGLTQRLTQFFEEVLLRKISAPIVIFVDEIDTTLSLDFTDDFYAAVRSLYLNRAQLPEFHRLSFVLIGVATPSDLIADPSRTPFNIGQRVDLTDFTFEEVRQLSVGLGLPPEEAEQTLRWALDWTGGHPYLTQRLCYEMADKNLDRCTQADVEQAVQSTFLGEMSKRDNNLQFVRDMLLLRSPDLVGTLSTYREVLSGKQPVPDEEQSLVKSHLKLSGVVNRVEENLEVRNLIYRDVFDLDWVKEHLPINWIKRLRQAAYGLTATFFIALIPLSIYADMQRRNAVEQRKVAEKEAAGSNKQKEEADRQRVNAEQQRANAEQQKEEADRQRANAEQQKEEADRQRAEAEASREDAEIARRESDSLRVIAEQRRQEAVLSQKEEEKQKNLALDREQEARQARQEAEDSRILAESERVIAQSSDARRAFSDGDELEALTATLEAKQVLDKIEKQTPDVDRATAALKGAMLEIVHSVRVKNILEDPSVEDFESVLFDTDSQLIVGIDCDTFTDVNGLQALKVRRISWNTLGEKTNERDSPPVYGSYRQISDEMTKENCNKKVEAALDNHQFSINDEVFGYELSDSRDRIKIVKTSLEDPKVLSTSADEQRITSISFFRDGKTMLAVTDRLSANLYDYYTGEGISLFEKETPGEISDIDFIDANDRLVIIASVSRKVKYDSAFGENYILPATSYIKEKLLLFDVRSRQLSSLNIQGLHADVSSISTSPNGDLIALGIGTPIHLRNNGSRSLASFDQGGILLVETKNSIGETSSIMRSERNITDVQFSPDGFLIAAGDSEGRLSLWNYRDNESRYFEMSEDNRRRESRIVTGIAFSKDGSSLASVDSSGRGKLWSFLDENISENLKDAGEFISPDPLHQLFATSDSNGSIRFWNWLGDEVGRLTIQPKTQVTDMDFSADGAVIAISRGDGSMDVRETNLERLTVLACDWASDYLANNPNISDATKALCLTKY